MATIGTVYYGLKKQYWELGAEIKRGGEGVIYAVNGDDTSVIKLLNDVGSSAQLEQKLKSIIDDPRRFQSGGPAHLQIAWPSDVLYADSWHTRFAGYAMPRAEGIEDLSRVMSERGRLELFGDDASWLHNLTVACNLAMAMEHLHDRARVVLGDMQPKNFCVRKDCSVVVVDTDAFAFTDRDGHSYQRGNCAGLEHYQAPEILNGSTRRYSRETDLFSLAVLIFQLLTLGAHPFSVPVKTSNGQTNMRDNMVRGICAYVSRPTNRAVRPNEKAVPDMKMFPAEIRALFDRAFTYTEENADDEKITEGRPTAAEWVAALTKLAQADMVTNCPNSSRGHVHIYPAAYRKRCPWCAQKGVICHPGSRFRAGRKTAAPKPAQAPSRSTGRTAARNVPGSRSVLPLYFACLTSGAVVTTLLARQAAEWLFWLVYRLTGDWLYNNLGTFARYIIYGREGTGGSAISNVPPLVIIAAVVGLICGFIVAAGGADRYQDAVRGWPWLLLALIVPVISCAALMLIVLLLVLVRNLLTLIGLIIAIRFIWSIFN